MYRHGVTPTHHAYCYNNYIGKDEVGPLCEPFDLVVSENNKRLRSNIIVVVIIVIYKIDVHCTYDTYGVCVCVCGYVCKNTAGQSVTR